MKKIEKKMFEVGFELLTMYGSIPFSSLVLLQLRHSTTNSYRRNTKTLNNTIGVSSATSNLQILNILTLTHLKVLHSSGAR